MIVRGGLGFRRRDASTLERLSFEADMAPPQQALSRTFDVDPEPHAYRINAEIDGVLKTR